MIMGGSGTGKTTSIRNLKPEETYLISIISKSLPFPNWKSMYKTSTKEIQGNRKIVFENNTVIEEYKSDQRFFKKKIDIVCKAMKAVADTGKFKTIIVDDSQYIMAYEFLGRSHEKGFDKYNDMASNLFQILSTAQSLPDDITVFFLHHTEIDQGIKKAKTLGKMIDNVLTLEGIFTIVLESNARKSNGKLEYYFTTQSDGTSTAKSPMGMFPLEVENDLQIVINYINKYKGDE